MANLDARAVGIVVFIAGGLLVFQGSAGLDLPKIAYMAATVAIVAAAGLRLVRDRTILAQQAALISWLSVSATFLAMTAISLVVATRNGTPLTDWLRDATPYAMFAIAVILWVDGRSLPRRFFGTILVASGLLAAISFSIEWMGRRNILDLPIDRLILPTGILASSLLAYAAARAMRAHWASSVAWVFLGGATLGMFFVTGTRSALLLVIVPIVVAVASRRGAARIVGVSGGVLAIGLATSVLFTVTVLGVPTGPAPAPTPVASATTGASPAPAAATTKPNPIGERIASIQTGVADPASDASFSERIAQTKAAWEVLASHAVLGTGPGYRIQWTSAVRGPMASYTLDTPLVLLSKFGLLGAVVLAWLLVVYARTLWACRHGRSARFLTLVGFGTVFVIAGLLNSPFEDKGLSFAILLILGIALAPDPPSRNSATQAQATRMQPAL